MQGSDASGLETAIDDAVGTGGMAGIEASPVELGELPAMELRGAALIGERLDLIGDLKVKLRALLGEGDISVADLFAIRDGSVVPLQCGVHPVVDIELDRKTIARGELVVVGDTLGVRVTEVSRGLA